MAWMARLQRFSLVGCWHAGGWISGCCGVILTVAHANQADKDKNKTCDAAVTKHFFLFGLTASEGYAKLKRIFLLMTAAFYICTLSTIVMLCRLCYDSED